MKDPSNRWRSNPRIRTAMRLQSMYAGAVKPEDNDLEQAMDRLLPRLRQLQVTWRMLRSARSRCWHAAEGHLHRRLLDQVQDVRTAAESPALPLRQILCRGKTTARGFYEELAALEQEFDEVTHDFAAGTISVVTDVVTLDELPLGRFRIQLDLSRLVDRYRQPLYAVRAIALEPNPPGHEPGVTHPHVRDDVPCLGDASTPVRNALVDGRLLDAFQLIDRVLQNYNDNSAYVQLEDWSGVACGECGRTSPLDDSGSCEQCSSRLCDGCMYSCDECNSIFCRSCLTEHDGGSGGRGRGRNGRDTRLLCESCLTKAQESEEEIDDEEANDDEDADNENADGGDDHGDSEQAAVDIGTAGADTIGQASA